MRSPKLLLLLVLCPFLASCGRPAGESKEDVAVKGKVLVIGLDGADWEILDRLESKGTIPNLARLRREGASGVLRSEEPMLSPILWTTIATGRSPVEHGILGFLTQQAGHVEPVRSDERKVRAFWNVASEAGRKVGVIGWYASWPAEPVNGFLVSDRAGSHQIAGAAPTGGSTAVAWPETLIPEIETMRAEIERAIGTTEAARYFTAGGAGAGTIHVDREPLDTFIGILRSTELYRRLAPALMDRFRPDLAAVYFEGTDAVGHLYADAQDPPMPWLKPMQAAPASQVWDRYYATVDGVVGELLQHVNPAETTVLVVSDHGFKTGARRPEIPSRGPLGNQAPLWHRPEGVLLLWGRGVRPGVKLPDATLYDVLPTMFRLLELPLAATLRGRPVDAAFTSEVLNVAVRSVPDYEMAGARAKGAGAGSEADASEHLAKLRALGYVGSGEGPGSAPAGVSGGQAGVPLNRYNEAMVLLQANKSEEALAVLHALQKDAPGFPLGWYGEGMVHLARNEPAAAIPPLQHAVGSEPRLAPAHALLGEALARVGRSDEALRATKEAARLEPGNAKPALLAGSLLLARQKIDEAEPYFAGALKAAPVGSAEQARALVGLGVIAHGRKRPQDAFARFQEALAVSPEQPGALEGLAVLALERGESGEALQLSERLVRATREDPRALTLQARALIAAGREQDAVAVLRRALAIRPDPEARKLLSQLGAGAKP
ncbi:MAG TPA: alkaline phosphatase family protein [Candidatus Polarisedimenticolaceae bacterium]|nr:alkaline phosphatase family protein [Candidatus Polarisedimenticolaceae bacterium]